MNIWLIWSFLNNKLFLRKKLRSNLSFFLFFQKNAQAQIAFGVRKKLIILTQIFDFYSDLFHSVSISKGNRSIFFTLLIDSDTVRSSDFILSSISFLMRGRIANFIGAICFGKWITTRELQSSSCSSS